MTGPASVAPSDAQTPRAASWALLLLGSAAAAACIAAPHVRHYDASFQWSIQQLGRGELAQLAWLVASACAWALTPGLAVAGLLLLAGRTRVAWAVAALGSGLLLFWLAIDLRVDVVTGNHALEYLRFLGGEEPWQWGGGAGEIVWPMLALGGLAALGGVALIEAARRVARRLGRASTSAAQLAAFAATGLYALLLAGPIVLARAPERPLVWMRLHDALPLSLPFFEVGSTGERGPDAWFQQLNQQLASLYPLHATRLTHSQPVAQLSVAALSKPPPNVIVIVLESFRRDSIDSRWMPRVQAFAESSALRSKRHYSTSHASHLGLFSLLFGRSPLVYEVTLVDGVPAQLPYSLRRSGYRSALLSSSALDWQGMDEFLSRRNFDEIVIEDKGRWPGRDHRVLTRLEELLAETSEKPLFAFVFLMSTHYNYQYPKFYERHLPVVENGVLSWDQLLESGGVGPEYRVGLLNRYRNSLAFLDDRLGRLLESFDLERNIVMLTGDHGESFYDDGRWLHGSRLSDAQLGVPWLIAGPGIAPGELPGPSTHLDVLPTLLHAVAGEPVALPNPQGRDLLAAASAGEPELLLVGMGVEYRHLLLMRGDRRMHLRLDLAGEELKTLGFLDEKGSYLPEQEQPEGDALRWLDAVDRQLGALSP